MYVLKIKKYSFHTGFYKIPANGMVRNPEDGYIDLSLKTELPLCAFFVNYEEEDEPRVFVIKEDGKNSQETIVEIIVSKNFPIDRNINIIKLIFAL